MYIFPGFFRIFRLIMEIQDKNKAATLDSPILKIVLYITTPSEILRSKSKTNTPSRKFHMTFSWSPLEISCWGSILHPSQKFHFLSQPAIATPFPQFEEMLQMECLFIFY